MHAQYLRHVIVGYDVDYSGNLQCFVFVDVLDDGICVGAAEYLAVKHIRHIKVARILELAHSLKARLLLLLTFADNLKFLHG